MTEAARSEYVCHFTPSISTCARISATDFRTLVVPHTHNKFGDRSFSAAGPRQWNDLPPELRRPDLSFPVFKQKLKTLLFDRIAQ